LALRGPDLECGVSGGGAGRDGREGDLRRRRQDQHDDGRRRRNHGRGDPQRRRRACSRTARKCWSRPTTTPTRRSARCGRAWTSWPPWSAWVSRTAC